MGAKQRRIWTDEGARGLTLEERKLSHHGGLDVLMTVSVRLWVKARFCQLAK